MVQIKNWVKIMIFNIWQFLLAISIPIYVIYSSRSVYIILLSYSNSLSICLCISTIYKSYIIEYEAGIAHLMKMD